MNTFSRFCLSSSLVLGLMCGAALPAAAKSRIKDVVDFEGVRDNVITGYGPVVGLAGTAVAQDLVAQSPQRLAYGSYQLRFLPAAGGELPVGEVNDQGGPLELHARLLLKPSLQWSLEGQVSARPAADPALAQLLQSLSPPDAKGLRPFSVGSL